MHTAGQRGAAGLVAVGLVLGAVGLTGCGAIAKVSHAVHTVESNKSTIATFTKTIKSAQAAPFEATYVTTGSAPATIVYAVKPPDGVSFSDTPAGSSTTNVDIVVNSSGEYTCTPGASGSAPTCQKLGRASVATENQIFNFYTPAHWIGFLRDFSLAAGLAGDKVTSSSKTVNGFSMQCVDFVATGVPGTSTICTTSQGILGYVNVASDSTSFEITRYSSTQADSLFALPAGARVTTTTTGTTGTGTT